MSAALDGATMGVLAMLGEQFAVLAGCPDLESLAGTTTRNLKWMVPCAWVRLVVADEAPPRSYPGAAPFTPGPKTGLALERGIAVELDPAEARAELGLEAAHTRVLPLLDQGRRLGVLAVGADDRGGLPRVERSVLDLFALGLASVVAKLLLLERERRARQVAERATRSRDDLIASVVHDLRSPLNAMNLTLELMHRDESRRGAPDPDRLEDLGELFSSSTHMRDMVDELLDASRIGAGAALTLRREDCDLAAASAKLVAAARARAGPRLVFEAVEGPVPGAVDPSRFRRVLTNLLDNAIKYAPQGEIHVRTAVEADAFVFAVRDHGIGIPEADLPGLFERFRRASNVGEIEGTGVGLATSYELVVRHGGTLEVDSAAGEGSTFTVRLPL